MRIAAVQHDIVWEARDTNLARYTQLLAQAGDAELVLFTEMFAVGFSMNTAVTAEAFDGPTVTWMRSQAANRKVAIAGSVPLVDDRDTRPFNTFVIARADGTCETYNKLHPFTYSGEDAHFAPGDTGHIADIAGMRVGISVCYDLRFAPLYYQRAPQVEVELVVASWPQARREHWLTLARARAIENQTYVVAVNRVGEGGGLTYSGDSRIFDPQGNALAKANNEATILTATLDPATVFATRKAFPVFNDRRAHYDSGTDIGPSTGHR